MKLTSLIGKLCNKDVKKIGLFGLGASNKRIAEILLEEGWQHGFTLRSSDPIQRSIAPYINSSYFGEYALTDIQEELLLLSPSVRREDKILRVAESSGCILSSDSELFFSSNPKNVLAITGSDGKSTVTYLTSKLTEATLAAPPSGNFGLPLCELLRNGEPKGSVVELSSFQLTYMKPASTRALITNITENHLNWHKDFFEYISAKKNIFANAQTRAIVPDGEICERIALEENIDVLVSDKLSSIELVRKYRPKLTVTKELEHICINGTPTIPLSAFLRTEDYNIKNFMCALALGWEFTDKDTALELAKSFSGLPHRKEIFLTKNGIRYVNSSIDSTPSRTEITLSSLSDKAIVIVGGASKGLSYEPLIRAIKSHAKTVILTGQSANALFGVFSGEKDFPTIHLEYDFEYAVELAVKIATPGDTVILSPAHTSYDRFENFEERGEYFKKIIKKITK